MPKTGVHRSLVLPPDLDRRLSRLMAATGMTRNAVIKRLIAQATPDSVTAAAD